MIEIHYGPNRLTAKGIIETAWCDVDGQRYEAESAFGSIHALCRVLREAGVPDQPWRVVGRLKGGSIHRAADWTVSREGRMCRAREFGPAPVQVNGKSGGSEAESAERSPEASQERPSVDSDAGVCGDPRRPLPELW